MILGETRGPVKVPDRNAEPPKESGLKVEKGEDSPNFEKMIVESNFEKQAELEKEKAAASGDFRLGETKNDREFRQQLEKVTGKKQDKAKNKLERDDYLNLLVTQLKYQDPSKPMEHFEMASQMAQFNTVEQLMGVNKVLTEMKKMQNDSKAEKLSQYLGKDIELQGDQLKITEDGKISSAKFELDSPAGNTVVEIRDEQAKLVRSIPLGPKQAGAHKITWNGLNDKGTPVVPGNYKFNVLASTDEGKPMTTKLSYVAKVEGITDILSGGKLDTNLGTADPSKIVAIRNPEELTKVTKPTNPIGQKLYNEQGIQKADDPLNKNPQQNKGQIPTLNGMPENQNAPNPQNIAEQQRMIPPQMQNAPNPQNIAEQQRMMPPQMQNAPSPQNMAEQQRMMPPQMQNAPNPQSFPPPLKMPPQMTNLNSPPNGEPQRLMPRQAPKSVDNAGAKEVFTSPNNPVPRSDMQKKSADMPPQISPQKYGGPPPVAGINGRAY
ncbi:flagellar hook assembly protein FlgD [Fluviispira multicolorata]|uniref:Basal-body rod modification protein FlgD n=1 Tax=Fluviispira multicolorata TaxID=2654512 RepID=A0A833N178_9BACT|nr:FlgD immunoglobulin-like domain containing protein [Fluviispira multicolorata]KAB8029985.1 hypothetical protein GCL57_10640 [Fluviispira multicolorata]